MTHATYYTGDVLDVLATLEPGSVDLVLTSPPFLALRSYLPADHPDKAKEGGQEKTPGEFIDWLLNVVEACDRVLAPHGSMAFELGDTYSGGWYHEDTPDDPRLNGEGGSRIQDRRRTNKRYQNKLRESDLRGWSHPKSLALIPETFRFALAYGINPHTGRKTTPWRVRNVVRWVRPNPPVGALGDKFRPATSEMVVFCRTDEAGRRRYFDLDAVREPPGNGQRNSPKDPANAGRQTWGTRENTGYAGMHTPSGGGEGSDQQRMLSHPAGAPPLDWWEIPTHPYKGAHYATWPPALCVRPIKAMSPEKVCATCGEASRRVVETNYEAPSWSSGGTRNGLSRQADRIDQAYSGLTTGWTDCGHDTWRPGIVLDPFAGSGTTLAVAVGHGRNAIGIDLDERNVELARERIGPMFFTWANEPGGAA